MRLTTILTDLDGVVRLWPSDVSDRAEREAGLPPGAVLRAAFADDLLAAAITGQVSDEDWRQQAVAALATEHPNADAVTAVKRWSASPGTVDMAVLEVLRACRRRARVVLVTNATTRLPLDLKRLGLGDEFDAVINSSVIGFAKPDRRVFEASLGAVGAKPEEALFVDDTRTNVEAAKEFGMQAHHFGTVGELRRELWAQGLLEPARAPSPTRG